MTITIVGAGLGGLMLARVLYVHGIECQIFDSDVSLTSRHQGGMLDIHEESGQAALRAADLFDDFRKIVLEEGDALRLLDKNAVVWLDQAGDDTRPEVERGSLRSLLASSLPKTVIQWGRRVAGVKAVASGGYEVAFADGPPLRTDILIGADGAWSKVRFLLSDAVPVYCGLSFVEARIPDSTSRYPELSAVVGKGFMLALSDEKGIIAHREFNDEICTYAAFKTPIASAGETTLQAVLARFADWRSDLRGLIAKSDDPLVIRPIYALPVGHRWDRLPGLTLLGDAAHLMSPFAGEGANLAMQDGAELALSIAANPDDIEAAFARYESAMFTRSAEAAAVSAQSLERCFDPAAPQPLLEFFRPDSNVA